MILIGLALAVVFICFGGVLLFGAPYLPTLKPQVEMALQLAGLERGQTLIELGCGDGRVLAAAAERGLCAEGYELNPLLWVVAWLRTRRYRGQVRVRWGNFWVSEWPPADAVFVFLLPRFMAKLDKKCGQYPHKPLKLVSYAFEIPGKQPKARENGIFVYEYR